MPNKTLWEIIEKEDCLETDRIRIPQGWIVRTRITVVVLNSIATSIHQIIVSDPKHEWKI